MVPQGYDRVGTVRALRMPALLKAIDDDKA
jgi:hypothetical protein